MSSIGGLDVPCSRRAGLYRAGEWRSRLNMACARRVGNASGVRRRHTMTRADQLMRPVLSARESRQERPSYDPDHRLNFALHLAMQPPNMPIGIAAISLRAKPLRFCKQSNCRRLTIESLTALPITAVLRTRCRIALFISRIAKVGACCEHEDLVRYHCFCC